MRTFSVQTLGCKVNQYESEQLAAVLRGRGLLPVEAGRDADLRVINTCSVTTGAAAKSRQLCRRVARQPGRSVISLPQFASGEIAGVSDVPHERGSRTNPRGQRVVVTGCWATSDRSAAEAIQGVDAVIGHHQDVALELIRLLDLWQGCGTETVSAVERAAPEPLGNEGWMNQAGSPAGTSTDRITLSYERDVNEKKGGEVLSLRTSVARGTTSLPLLSSRQTGRQRAHLKIQDGCDAHCTYCIIPSLRPTLWSKPVADVVLEANRLVEAGHVELILTGIFLGAYGQPTALRRRRPGVEVNRDVGTAWLRTVKSEHGAGSTPLASLTDALCRRVPGLKRLRFSSLEPGDLDAELIAVLRSHPQVVPHFHLPLQSGSNALLRRMNRQYTSEDYLRMVDLVRGAFDRPALTTDIIVGFPGESDQAFERTLEVARYCRFLHIHAFSFSPRPGTAAARWATQLVPGATVNQRIEALRSLSEADSLNYRRQFVGETAQLLVEREKGEEADSPDGTPLRHGRCERYFMVHFDDPTARPGDFVRVRIDRVETGKTFGTKVETPA
jgi:threonylcarbamoyladenosine tRNA methylthiotransferase MtaB